MRKQKQQTISRFFSHDSKQPSPPPSSPSQQTSSRPYQHSISTPKVIATLSFSPTASASKRAFSKTLTPTSSPLSKKHRSTASSNTSSDSIAPLCRKTLDLDPLSRNPKYTPLEQQVVELKSKHPDVLLMIEVGYKYCFFGEDAENASRVLGIFAHIVRNFVTASIPSYRLNFHVRRLVMAGYKVGVVKQTETSAIKSHGVKHVGPFRRELSALYTRSTIDTAEDLGGDGGEDEGLGGCNANYLFCIVEQGLDGNVYNANGNFDVKIGVVAVEISTGDVMHGEFNDNVTRSGLEATVSKLSPTEILLGNPLSIATEKLLLAYAGPTSDVRVERASRGCFNDGSALSEVISMNRDIAGDTPKSPVEAGKGFRGEFFGIEEIMAMPELSIQALALTIRYLKQFGFERILCLSASFRPLNANFEMKLSLNTLQQLEIVKNKSDGSSEGSLLRIMDHTCTSFGSRLLKHWVTHPLCDRLSISARLDAVSEIVESMGSSQASNQVMVDEEPLYGTHVQLEIDHVLSSVLKTLGRMPDVQRGITRIFHQTATPAEVFAVIHAILLSGKNLQKLSLEDNAIHRETTCKIVQSQLLKRLILTASSSTVIANASKLLSCLNKDAADKRDMSNLFSTSHGEFLEIIRRHAEIQSVQEKLNFFIFQYRERLKIQKLEFVSVHGITHLIELPSNVKVPCDWMIINSTKTAVRYHPPEVIKCLNDLALVKDELAVACKAAWKDFLIVFARYYAEFQAAIQALAALDCLYSLAILSRKRDYVRPIFVDDTEPDQIEIISGRHPVLESILGENFIPNNTCLNALWEFCLIITGPNMGGKSSYIRQIALIAIMAQVGSFVPASSAKLHVLDGIYTRIGVSDNIQQGRSTFFEELSEASEILHQCSSHSLIIIDELGRGTSTHDGIAIAFAALHYLLEHKKCMVLFVTHYPKIMDIQHKFAGSVGAYHVSYLTSKNSLSLVGSEYDTCAESLDESNITFLYKVVPGVSDKSFGINVARLAQLPTSCIARAIFMATKMEEEVNIREQTKLSQNKYTETYTTSDTTLPGSLLCSEFGRFLSLLHFLVNHAKSSQIFGCLNDAKELAVGMMKKMDSGGGNLDASLLVRSYHVSSRQTLDPRN